MFPPRPRTDTPVKTRYPRLISRQLQPTGQGEFFAVDMFAGCGGRALGFDASDITTTGFEMDRHACATCRKNLHAPTWCILTESAFMNPEPALNWCKKEERPGWKMGMRQVEGISIWPHLGHSEES